MTTEPRKAAQLTPTGRVSFPHLFTPQAMEQGQEPKFSVVLIFDREAQATPEFKAMVEAANNAVKETWKGHPPENLRKPFRRAEDKKDQKGNRVKGYDDGAVFVTFSCNKDHPPQVVGRDARTPLKESDVYAGCHARVSWRVYAYDKKGNKGVSFGLGNVQFIKDGERLGGGGRAEDEFAPLEETVGDELENLLG